MYFLTSCEILVFILQEQKSVVPQRMIVMRMLHVRIQDLEHINVHAMKVLMEMGNLVKVCLMILIRSYGYSVGLGEGLFLTNPVRYFICIENRIFSFYL